MTISVGDRIPEATLSIMGSEGPSALSTNDLFAGKKVVLFALPGAFTPTCSAAHVPGFLTQAHAIKAKGVDTIACLSVNDAFVMDAWGKAQNVGDEIQMVADGSGRFTQAVDLTLDLSEMNFGVRSQRYAMVVDDGVVTHLNIEEGSGLEVSDADSILALL